MKRQLHIALIPISVLLFAAVIILTVALALGSGTEKSTGKAGLLVSNGTADYTIVYRGEYAKSAAELLSSELSGLAGADFEVRDNKSGQTEGEIAIGIPELSGPSYVNAVNEIGNNGYKISFPESKKIEITAFTEDSANKAVLTLIREYLVKDSDEDLMFKTDLGYTSVEKGGTEPDSSLLKTKKTLRFDGDGNLKILLFSDVCSGNDVNQLTVDTIEKMVEKEEPDLVIFAGNIQNNIADKASLRDLLEKISAPMESRSIPWAHVFGPDDAASGMSPDLQMEVYDEFEFCISKKGDLSHDGVSNYFLPVFSSSSDDVKFGVFGLDSSLAQPTGGADKIYGFISPVQTSWFLSTYADLTRQTASLVPGIIITCTPVPEFAGLAESGDFTGNFNEGVSAPDINSGLFGAALSTKNILGIYCGSDHLNDFSGKYNGIELAYLASIGYDGYGFGGTFETNNSLRGARMLVINENDIANYTSKMLYAADYGVSREAK